MPNNGFWECCIAVAKFSMVRVTMLGSPGPLLMKRPS